MSEATDPPVHLLVFTAEPLAGGYGSSTALRMFIRATLGQSDWRITVVAPSADTGGWLDAPPRLQLVRAGGRHVTTRPAELCSYAARAVLHAVGSAQLRPDVVLSWQPLPSGLAGAVAARLCRAPHVVRTCGPELCRSWSRFPALTSMLHPLTVQLLRRADAVVIKSEVERGLLGPSVEQQRVHLIPNAVGPEFFVSRPGHGDGSATRLLTICQLESHKRVAELLSTLGTVASRYPGKVRLTVAGEGSQRASLQRTASDAGIEASFLGRVPHLELPALCAVHDALILPSLVEGCSNAALEAMAAGLPVLGHGSALSELVDDGVNGVLAGTPDLAGLQHAIARFLGAGGTLSRMREAARRTAACHSLERLWSLYRVLLDDVRRGPPVPMGGAE